MVKIIFQQIVKKELYVKSCVYRKVMMQIYLREGVIRRSSGGAWVPNEGGVAMIIFSENQWTVADLLFI